MADDRGAGPVLLAFAALAGFLAASYSRRAPVPVPAAAAGADWRFADDAPIPVESSLWSVVKRTAMRFNNDRLMTEAAGVTFYTLLALFPALATLISLYGLFADPVAIANQLQAAEGIVPGGGIDIIKGQITALTANGHQALGWSAALGFLASVWSANAGIKSLFDALNIVYHEREKRSYVRLTLVCFCFTVGALVFLVAALSAIVVVPIVFTYVGLGNEVSLLGLLRWPLLMVALVLFLSLVYRFGPSRKRVRWQWVTWGSAFAAVAWVAVSIGFSYYVANFGSYNRTYGSLGAAIGFMTWIWISTMVMLLGGELNAEMEQRTGRPTKRT